MSAKCRPFNGDSNVLEFQTQIFPDPECLFSDRHFMIGKIAVCSHLPPEGTCEIPLKCDVRLLIMLLCITLSMVFYDKDDVISHVRADLRLLWWPHSAIFEFDYRFCSTLFVFVCHLLLFGEKASTCLDHLQFECLFRFYHHILLSNLSVTRTTMCGHMKNL